MITHILFDFFETLVQYTPVNNFDGYKRSHQVLERYGVSFDYCSYLDQWFGFIEVFELTARRSLREYALGDVVVIFLRRVLNREPHSYEIALYMDTYTREWNMGVTYFNELSNCLEILADHYKLGIVSNTIHSPQIYYHLKNIEVHRYFEHVITSVDVGRRKPHQSIFQATLIAFNTTPEQCLFVGDSFEADYRGAKSIGMKAVLIDLNGTDVVPSTEKISSVLELPHMLSIT